MRPLIAVTTPVYSGEDFRSPQIMLGTAYIAALERAGATAILLTPAHGPESIEAVLDATGGLMLTGGEDIEPRRYGQEPHPKLGSTNRERDELEFAALAGALQRERPVLAICRGMQLLNVAMGGTLYQDLASQLPGPLTHQQQAAIDQRWHAATVEEDSALAGIFGTTDLHINSFHHQAVDRLGEGLRAVARAEDGLVEAVEARDHAWVVGVQWHPERGEAERPGEPLHPDRRLFQAFVDAVRQHGSA